MGAASRPLTPMAVTPHTLNISPSTHNHHRVTTTSSLPTRPPPLALTTLGPYLHGCPPCYMVWRWVPLAVRSRLWPSSHHTPSTSRPPLTITTASPRPRPSLPSHVLPHSLAVPPTYTGVRLLDGMAMGAVNLPHTPMVVTPHTLNISPSAHKHHRITTTSSLPTRPPPPAFITHRASAY